MFLYISISLCFWRGDNFKSQSSIFHKEAISWESGGDWPFTMDPPVNRLYYLNTDINMVLGLYSFVFFSLTSYAQKRGKILQKENHQFGYVLRYTAKHTTGVPWMDGDVQHSQHKPSFSGCVTVEYWDKHFSEVKTGD